MIKISIITAVYNREATIKSACEAMANQDYDNIEWVVVDGGSKDGTVEILKKAKRRPDILISEPDKGIYDALNKGLELCSGDIVGLLHSDDFYPEPDVLSKVAQKFMDTKVDAVYGDLEYVKEDKLDVVVRRWISGEYDKDNFKKGWMPPHPSFYMRRKYYRALGGFDMQYKIAADYDSMVRYLWKNNLNASYLPKVLMSMRTGGVSNNGLHNILRKSKEDLSIMRKHGLGLLTLVRKNVSKIAQFF